MFCLTDMCYPDIMNLVKPDNPVVRLEKCVALLFFYISSAAGRLAIIHGG